MLGNVVDRHHFDADPDPDTTFHFDADSDPDLDPESTPVLHVLENLKFFDFYS
jgi:hypothetical protein